MGLQRPRAPPSGKTPPLQQGWIKIHPPTRRFYQICCMSITTRWIIPSDVPCFAISFSAFWWTSTHVHSPHATSSFLLTPKPLLMPLFAFFLPSLSVSPQLLKHHAALTLSQAKAHFCLCARGCFTDTWALSSNAKWERGLSLSATRRVWLGHLLLLLHPRRILQPIFNFSSFEM